MPFSHCQDCGKPLELSQEIDFGLCSSCYISYSVRGIASEEMGHALLKIWKGFVVCIRTESGTIITNIPRTVIHYSPAGYDWGFGGRGAADLALNILACFLPLQNEEEGIKLTLGYKVSRDTWRLHLAFKEEIIATMPRAGQVISKDEIEEWLRSVGVKDSALSLSNE